MYGLDWLDRLKLRTSPRPQAQELRHVSPVVWALGVTSFLTDISSEMVNSILPIYLVLYLHLSPVQYGAIDGVYNGVAAAFLGLAGGLVADRKRRYKEVAAAGYAISAVCKLFFLAGGATWGWITAVTAVDRIGKGGRTAPRDAMISLASLPQSLATSFAVHRAFDAGGALLGPLIAFVVLSYIPNDFGPVWATSFVFALLGLAVLWLFVQNPTNTTSAAVRFASLREILALFREPRFRMLTAAGVGFGAATISDGFIYLLLNARTGLSSGFFPLFYVATSAFYMLLSIPIGKLADKWGRSVVLVSGYGVLVVVYLLLCLPGRSVALPLVCLFLLGLYYAATEGVLMAFASAVIRPELRTSGLALLLTSVGLAKMMSSILFGWMWQVFGSRLAVMTLGGALIVMLIVIAPRMFSVQRENAV